jgi:succinoglycan biosynthesis transport protein ExoP
MTAEIQKRIIPTTNNEIVSSSLRGEISTNGLETLRSTALLQKRDLRRWRSLILLSIVSGITIGCFITAIQPRSYRARASLEIQSLNDNFLNMKQVLPVDETDVPGTFSDLQTQIKIIQSDSVRDPVAAAMVAEVSKELAQPTEISWGKHPLLLLRQSISDVHHTKTKVSDQLIQAEVARIFDSLQVRAIGQTRIIELTAESRYPRVAAVFLRHICDVYISKNMDARWELSQRTSDSLERLLEDVRVKLQQSETALQNYASASGLMFTSDRQSVAKEKLSQLQQEFSQAQATRIAAQSRYEVAVKTLAHEDLPDAITESPIREYKNKLTELQRDRAELATTYTSNYAKIKRLDAQISSLQSAIQTEEQAELRHIQGEYNADQRRESLLASKYQEQSGIVSDAETREIQYNILRHDVDGNQQLYDEMLKQVKQATISSAVRSSNVRILDAAKPPALPYSPILIVNCACAILGCLAVGIAVGLIRERIDSRLREPGEGRYYLGLPELGTLPHDRTGAGLLRLNRRAQLSDNRSGTLGTLRLTEGFRNWAVRLGASQLEGEATTESCLAVIASLLLPACDGKLSDGRLPRSVVVTSAGPREGKSTVVANLGLTLASTGRRVLLVDGDLRCPRLHLFFGLDNQKGLSQLLRSPESLDVSPMSMIQTTDVASLSVLTTGPKLQHSVNFLQSPNLTVLLEKFEKTFDIVLIDTPPVLQVADARVIGRFANGVIVVARAGQTVREAAAAACERLLSDNAKILGLILNDWNPKSTSYGYLADYRGEYRET